MHKNVLPPKTWVIIPAYNEQKYIELVLEKVLKFTPHIVVIDDGSRDKTAAKAKKLVPNTVRHPKNLGKGAALKTGCELAFNELGAEAVVFLDADDQHNPVELELFGQALNEGHHIIFGERKIGSEMPLIKIMGNRFASFLMYVLYGTYIPDIPSGFKAITKKGYSQIAWLASDYGVELEIAVRVAKKKLPFKTVQITTIYHDYDRGMTLWDVLKMSTKLLTWKFTE